MADALPQNTGTAAPTSGTLASIASGFSGQNPSGFTFTPSQTPVQPTQPPVQPSPNIASVVTPSGNSTPSGLDPQIVNLAKAIRQTETGGAASPFTAIGKSGEYGAYQFMPSTWDATAPKFGVNVPLSQATPDQQNQVAYEQLSQWKTEHPDWNVGNFASAWNAGAGAPDAYLTGNSGTNSKGVAYDTPGYASKVANAYQTFKVQTVANTNAPTDTTSAATQDAAPSLGGFAQNVLQSGLSLLGNVGEATLHPIQTVENIGGTAVGGIEKAARETTDNTAKFDNVVNFFKNRYGSLDQLEKTLYTDPVGVAADLSTVLGVGGGALGLAGKAADVAKLGETGSILGKAGELANTASDLTNPLSPITAGIGKLTQPALDAASGAVGKLAGFEPSTIDAIRTNPESFTPEQIANVTREAVAKEVGTALNERITSLDETGASYKPIKDSTLEIPVSHNFLEDQLRTVAKVYVQDGKIIPTTVSKLTKSDLPKLQDILDTYKPAFQKGTLTPEEFLTLRKKLDAAAYGENGIKNSTVAEVASQIRGKLNASYRQAVPGLEELDTKFSTQIKDLKDLRKGLIDKDGNLTDSAYSMVANASNPSNASRLARLEQIVPGITQKIKVLKAIEDIQRSMGNKVGTYGSSIAKAGGAIGGLATGHLGVAATGFAAMIISEPANAVKIISIAEKLDPTVVPMVLGRLARYATITGESNRSTQESPDTSTETQSPETDTTTPPQSQPLPETSHDDLSSLAASHNFDLSSAQSAGYTPDEIQTYLNSLSN